MLVFENRYENNKIGILLLFIFAFSIQCNRTIVNTPEDENIIGKMTDIDGNEYKTIKIGNQIWMAENFRSTRYNNGEKIQLISEIREFGLDTTGAYCFYNNSNNQDTIRMFGALYSYSTIASNKLAPSGWRVPSKEDWGNLESFLISNKYNWDKTLSGNKIGKALASQSGWDTLSEPGVVGNDLSKNNKTQFCAYPSGQRVFRGTQSYSVRQEDNGFEGASKECHWWTSTGDSISAWCYSLGYCYDKLILGGITGLSTGFSIRLIKNGAN